MMTGKEFLRRVFTPGTVECGFGCALLGLATALLLLWLGVWKTLLIVVLVAIGAFLGGVKDKKAFVGRIVDTFRRD